MNALKYFPELKNRILLSFYAWVITAIVCYCYKNVLLDVIISFIDLELFKTYFIFTDVTEVFSVYVKLITFVSNQFLFLFTVYHIFMFLSPGFYYFEYINVLLICRLFIFTWLLSMLLLNKILLPISWKFFLSFQAPSSNFSLFFEAKILEYFVFYRNLYYICFLNVLLLAFLIFFVGTLSKNLKTIKSYRRIFYCIFILISTLSTPPDVFSQVALSISFIVFYEIFVAFKIFLILAGEPVKTG